MTFTTNYDPYTHNFQMEEAAVEFLQNTTFEGRLILETYEGPVAIVKIDADGVYEEGEDEPFNVTSYSCSEYIRLAALLQQQKGEEAPKDKKVNIMAEAHAMTRELKAKFPNADYRATFAACLKYLHAQRRAA